MNRDKIVCIFRDWFTG